MTNQLIKAKIKDIRIMGVFELDEFGVSLSTSMVDNKSKFYLYEEIDKRREELEKEISPMAESSEIDYDY